MTTETKFKQTEIGLIPVDWQMIELEKLFNIKAGGDLRKISFSKTKTIEYQYPIYSNSLNNEGLYGFSKTFQYEPDCVTITGRGDVGRAECRKEPFNAIVRLLVLKPTKLLSCEFISYFINTKLDFSHVGSAVNQLTAPMISKLRVANPPLQEQSAIAKILSDLDSKIELLQKQNETLEKIGQAIFKHWFVDFEFPNEEGKPYKSSGGEMVESELGEIPKGWNAGKLGDFVESVSGCSYTSKGLEQSDEALVTLKSISVNGFTQEGFKEYTGDYKDKHVVKDGDIVVAHTDLTQNRIILGKPAVVRDLGKYKVMIASMDLSVVRPISLLNRPYLFYLLSTNMFYGHAQGYANGTTVIHLSRKAVPEFPFIIPSETVLNQFKEFSNYLFDKISINQKSIKSLEKTRDLLLPKLMTGKIRVPLKTSQ